MRISRVFNNNSVGAVLGDGREAVLVGPGVGFNKHKGDDVDPDKVEKQYVLDPSPAGEGTRAVLASLPYAVVEMTSTIAERLAERHQLVLSAPVEIGLADHLATAIDRVRTDQPLRNDLLFEIKATYRDEFRIALDVLDWVDELSGHRLPVDEAGFITLHLVNAGLTGNMVETQRFTRALSVVLEIVREEIPTAVNPAHQERFVTHLKFVLRRLTERSQLEGGHSQIYAMLRESDPESFTLAGRIANHLSTTFDTELSEEEVLYLMIHVNRLRDASN